MRWGNGGHGYGVVSKVLHWGTVLALASQLAVGYLMDADDGGSGRGRGRGRGGESGRGRGGDEGGVLLDSGYLDDPDLLVRVHLVLGSLVVLLALARVGWRRHAGLPPWSEHLGPRQRRLAHLTERALLALLVVVPVTGMVLVASGDDDVVWLHVAGHVALFAALAAHLATNLRPAVLRRML